MENCLIAIRQVSNQIFPLRLEKASRTVTAAFQTKAGAEGNRSRVRAVRGPRGRGPGRVPALPGAPQPRRSRLRDAAGMIRKCTCEPCSGAPCAESPTILRDPRARVDVPRLLLDILTAVAAETRVSPATAPFSGMGWWVLPSRRFPCPHVAHEAPEISERDI